MKKEEPYQWGNHTSSCCVYWAPLVTIVDKAERFTDKCSESGLIFVAFKENQWLWDWAIADEHVTKHSPFIPVQAQLLETNKTLGTFHKKSPYTIFLVDWSCHWPLYALSSPLHASFLIRLLVIMRTRERWPLGRTRQQMRTEEKSNAREDSI